MKHIADANWTVIEVKIGRKQSLQIEAQFSRADTSKSARLYTIVQLFARRVKNRYHQ